MEGDWFHGTGQKFGGIHMNILRNLFGKKSNIEDQKEYVICPACGAGYNTDMVSASIMMKSPFMADMASWSTQVTCRNCNRAIVVSGSYNKVFGKPRSK
jgi:hypothetical protein